MFEITSEILPFLLLFCLGIALFHTFILSGIFNVNLKPGWIMFVIDPAILGIAFLFFRKESGIVFIALFLSVFAMAIIGMIKNGIESTVDSFKEQRKNKTPVWKIIGGGLLALLGYLAFFYLGIYSFFLIFFVIILSSMLPNNKNRFYFYQRTLPTSTIKSVAMGLAEISGKAKAIQPVISPDTDTPCVGYIYTVDEIHTTRDDDGRTSTSYHEISRKTDLKNFYIEDETGKIEIVPAQLQWINFSPAHSREDGGKRYQEYILDEKTDFLLIGQAFYEGANSILRFDEGKKVFGIAPLDIVNFSNKWRPLKLRAMTALACIAVLAAIILFTPITINGTKIIIEQRNWKEVLKSNPFESIFNR
ncbi:E3 ubiquitin ligase family protein [Chryseobacterium sp. OSA05B]|uniref:E3 ubiquitin ligase family protein n=1 Tax=Chryseobacterium sp. OSA05B TaxID=2862650 RepID=UPI001CC0177B|nr:E3 ubiquitin ligase family protein [Chryseobacterium sp. OSA05B]